MKNGFLQVKVNTQKTILSSESVFYKTESFIKQTKYISNVDFFISKFAETIIYHAKDILQDERLVQSEINCFKIETSDKKFSFLFKFGYQLNNNLNKTDIVFFDYITTEKDIRQNDQRINDYVSLHSSIQVVLKTEKKLVKPQDFSKLYLISNISGINLPRLSPEQKEIVETIDKNILVQGVAGSGKTNICIDKIIFSACKNYGGKVLYTTFSRGLLVDTKIKVEYFKKDLEQFLLDYKSNKVLFLDNNHKKALENKFGIYFFSDDDNQIILKIQKIVEFLTNKVDYLLIEDIYKKKFGGEPVFVNEQYFINQYSKNLANHQIEKCFNKLSKYSKEIIYKEVFGIIFGFYNLSTKPNIMPLNDYVLLRQNSFSKQDCETIYQIALDYQKHCQKHNLLDNNSASKMLIDKIDSYSQYSLAIIDEVQDYSQVNLCLFKKLSIKMFCVGDALQMINPSYFNFGYLKNLLYEKDVTEVKELKNNYRNTKKIEEIIDALGEINKAEFGTHSFVIKGQSVDTGLNTTAVFTTDTSFASQVASSNFDNFTFVVATAEQKANLQKIIKNQEVLTVSEIKGLERNTVVAYNLLSSNCDKWKLLDQNKVNHKQADENSVFRYYYNLFYVGVSRAKQNIFVVEKLNIKQFENFFVNNFEQKDAKGAIKLLSDIVSKIEFTQAEILERVKEFIKLEQYDNARWTANKIKDDLLRINQLHKIDINQNYIKFGKYREAGIKFWEYGMIEDAKNQFTISGDHNLIELVNACSKNNDNGLNIDIINYFEDVKENTLAQKFIVETVQKDIANLKSSFKQIKENFKKGRK